MQRRHFLSHALAGLAGASVLRATSAGTTAATVTGAGSPSSPLKIEKVEKTDDEWRKILTPAQYSVLRKEGTEYPFSSPLNNEKRKGTFVCAGCDLPLFDSKTKFDSGTGWPSFFTAIPNHVAMKKDYKIIVERDEYHCVRCGGHQGHLFDDGPPPTRQRWCNNGVALRFLPA